MNKYLVIPNISIQTANARPVWWLVSAAPVVPAVQFAHAIGRASGALPTGIHLVHHDAQHLGDHEAGIMPYSPQQRRGAMLINSVDIAGEGISLSMQPTASAHLALSLVLVFEVDAFSDWKSHEADRFLAGARFAGGQIISHGKLSEHDDLKGALHRIGRGFLVSDRSDLLSGHTDPLAAMMDALYPEKKEDKLPWLCPTNLGYILAEEPRARQGSRQGLPHAWAEPLAGLVQFKALSSALRQEFNPSPWMACWLDNFTWVVQQKEIHNDHS